MLLIVYGQTDLESEAFGLVPPSPPTAEQREQRRALGLRVKALRAEYGLTQEDLAERADLDRSYVAGVEAGRRNPSLDAICKIAKGLGVPTGALFVEHNRRE